MRVNTNYTRNWKSFIIYVLLLVFGELKHYMLLYLNIPTCAAERKNFGWFDYSYISLNNTNTKEILKVTVWYEIVWFN